MTAVVSLHCVSTTSLAHPLVLTPRRSHKRVVLTPLVLTPLTRSFSSHRVCCRDRWPSRRQVPGNPCRRRFRLRHGERLWCGVQNGRPRIKGPAAVRPSHGGDLEGRLDSARRLGHALQVRAPPAALRFTTPSRPPTADYWTRCRPSHGGGYQYRLCPLEKMPCSEADLRGAADVEQQWPVDARAAAVEGAGRALVAPLLQNRALWDLLVGY